MRKGTRDFFKLIAIFIAIALCGIGLLALLMWTSEPTVKMNVATVEWLPSTASNISYIETTGFGGMRNAEFTIAQADFEAFAAENGWALTQAKDVSIHFRDYIAEEGARPVRTFEENRVQHALYYENRHANGGGLTLVYDLDTGQGYYFYSHR